MDPTDASLQADEIEALSSIYGSDLVKEHCSPGSSQLLSMTVRNESTAVELRLFVKLPPSYPTSSPPTFEISSPYLDGKAKNALSARLQDIYVENPGQPVLFHWFEAARQFLDENAMEEEGKIATYEGLEPEEILQPPASCQIDPTAIQSGDPLTDRKSTFQAHLVPVLTKDDVRNALVYLKTNPKIARATHNIHAYRIHDGGRICIQDCDDDGEQQAGSRLMHLLEMMDARNVLIVVSRWYGGIHLGPDRFKHISNVAREILEKNGYGKQQGMAEVKKGEKKK